MTEYDMEKVWDETQLPHVLKELRQSIREIDRDRFSKEGITQTHVAHLWYSFNLLGYKLHKLYDVEEEK